MSGPDVTRTRTDQAADLALLEHVGHPADDARGRERGAEELPRDPERLQQHRRVELDIGLERALRMTLAQLNDRLAFDGAGELEASRRVSSSARFQPFQGALQDERSRVTHAIDAM